MHFLTRLMLLAIALAVCARPDYAQPAKTKQDAPTPAGPATPPVESNPRNWQEYSSPQGRFSVMFPGTLIKESDNSAEGLTGRQYSLTTTATYNVSYLDLPVDFHLNPEADAVARRDLFAKIRDHPVTSLKGKLIAETEITVDSHPGVLLKFSLPDSTIMTRKSVVVEKRIYTLLVITPDEPQAPAGARFDQSWTAKFLDSFKVGKAAAIEDNPEAWKTYTSTCGRFTALFPGIPTAMENSCDTDCEPCDGQMYAVITSVEYVVTFLDFNLELEQDPKLFNRAVDSIRDHTATAAKGKVLDDTAISIAGYKGRMVRIAGPDKRVATVKAFAVAKRLYSVMVVTPAISQTTDGGQANDSWATKFFDSFKITP